MERRFYVRLNMNCIRDILLCIENLVTPTKLALFINIDLTNDIDKFLFDDVTNIHQPLPHQKELLKKYTNEEIIYHLKYCVDANLIELSNNTTSSEIFVKDLTPNGHSFIENIRQDTIYNKVLSIAKEKAGSVTLETIIDISTKVISNNITSFFNS